VRQTPILRWLEPELFQPFLFGVLISLTISEFVRGALVFTLLPTYGKTVLGFAVEWTALALSVHYLVDNLLRSPAGWVIDRIGQRPMLLLGFCISVISVFWLMQSKNIVSLTLALAVYGLGVTPMWPCAVSGIGKTTPEPKRATFMGYMYIFWLIGTGLGPVLINFAILRTYHFAFWLLIAVDAIGVVLAFILVHDPQKNHSADKAFSVLKKTHTNWQDLWRNVREVAFLFPGMFAQTFAVASLIPILSVWAKVVLHVSGPAYSAILTSGGAITIVMLLPAGKLVDKFGIRKFLVSGFLIAGAALIVYPFYHTIPATYVVVGLLGLCYAFILPSWNAVLDHSIDPDKKATLWGVFMTVEGMGSAVGPYLGGLLWDKWSPSAPFWVSGAVIFSMGALYTWLPILREYRKVNLAKKLSDW
jgi:MFS transporter, DHA1 family, multidrug resistance protein